MADEQNEEIQRLRDHAAKVLEEKRQMKAERDELAGAVEALEAERDHAQAELKRVLVDQPRRAVFEEVAHRPEVVDAVEREVLHHADITDDGAMLDKEGEPLKGEDGEPLQFGEAAIHHLATTTAPALMSMIKPLNKSSGGGAPGSNGRDMAHAAPRVEPKPSPYGLK